VRWGAALRLPPAQANSELVLAVIPSLLGWCALLLPGSTQPLLALWHIVYKKGWRVFSAAA
jgi:hypothetical protein